MVDAGELPQWVTYVGGAAGIIIATVIVRLGWNSKAGELAGAPEQGRLIGALVDAGSVHELTEAIQSHAEVVTTTGEELGREMRQLSDEVRRLGNKLEK